MTTDPYFSAPASVESRAFLVIHSEKLNWPCLSPSWVWLGFLHRCPSTDSFPRGLLLVHSQFCTMRQRAWLACFTRPPTRLPHSFFGPFLGVESMLLIHALVFLCVLQNYQSVTPRRSNYENLFFHWIGCYFLLVLALGFRSLTPKSQGG